MKINSSTWALGKRRIIEPKNAKNTLNYDFDTNGEKMIKNIAESAIALGLIPDLSPNKEITVNYKKSEIDLTNIPPVSI